MTSASNSTLPSMIAFAKKFAETSRTPEQFRGEARIYFHHHNYAKFHFDLGGSHVKSVSFANYRYITDDLREQEQLDAVANVPGTFIYTLQDSDVEHTIQQELAAERDKDILKTAQAAVESTGGRFDPNVPIIPMQVQHVQSTPLQVMPVPSQVMPAPGAVVGLQNSFSGTQATEAVTGKPTVASQQTAAPAASSDAAKARLASLAADVNKDNSTSEK